MDSDRFFELFRQFNKFDKDNGLTFSVLSPGKITYQFEVKDKHMSSPDACHGAVIAGFMDCVLGLAALSYAVTEGNFTSTVEFKLNFIKPARLGDKLIGNGHLEYKGKSLIIASGEIHRESDQELIAKGLGTFNMYPMTKREDFKKNFGQV